MDTEELLTQLSRMITRNERAAELRHTQMLTRFADMEATMHRYHGDLLKLQSDVDDLRGAA